VLGFSDAVATGLAPDGGLYVPLELPDIGGHLPHWEALAYPELCLEFFRLSTSDMEADVLEDCIMRAYAGFTDPQTAPLVTLEAGLHVLELFHGPTLAFKDFALQLLGNLYEAQIRRTGVPINVLGATSGDTGAAAIHGLLGKEGVNIFILYPNGGVSPLQERQMTCSGAANVYPLRISGTFDDAQDIIKSIFGDLKLRHRYHLSAVNSINLARILAQCVYYIYAWLRLPVGERERVRFVVPTGNFGNVLAGWWTTRMGLPCKGFRVATNRNDILHRLFSSGDYKVGSVQPSLAPSMDIQVASNFERFLYYHEDGDTARVRSIMEQFKKDRRYVFSALRADGFTSSSSDDSRIAEVIDDVYRKFGYVADPHTACALDGVQADYPCVVLATAHPAKFPNAVEKACGVHPRSAELDALMQRHPVQHDLPATVAAVRDFIESTLKENPNPGS
jgi:threonine synthase